MLSAVDMALKSGVPSKMHVLNLSHRLVDGRSFTPPTLDAPQALTLTNEPEANVERYDTLRKTEVQRRPLLSALASSAKPEKRSGALPRTNRS